MGQNCAKELVERVKQHSIVSAIRKSGFWKEITLMHSENAAADIQLDAEGDAKLLLLQ